MQPLSIATILAFAVVTFGAPAGAASIPTPTPTLKPAKMTHIKSLGGAGLHGSLVNRPVSAAACNSRAAAMPGSAGTLGPNGASAAQTLVTIPTGGGGTAAATQRHEIDEACSHIRH